MSVEEQLKELLDKLDLVTSMRGCGARTRRIRLLRREINNIQYRQGHHPRHTLHNGHLKDDDNYDEEEEEDDEKDVKEDNGLSSSDKGGWWKYVFERYDVANACTLKQQTNSFFQWDQLWTWANGTLSSGNWARVPPTHQPQPPHCLQSSK